MLPLLFLTFHLAQAQEKSTKDISIDVGFSSGCMLGCITYDLQIQEHIDLGLTVTPLVLFNGGGIYGQYTFYSNNNNHVLVEPNIGILWSVLSREVFYGGGVSLGYERELDHRLFLRANLGGVGLYDLDTWSILPEFRLGIGTRL